MPPPALAIRVSAAAVLAALVSLQIIACSDDTHPASGSPEAGAGGESGSGGTAAGGKPSGGAGGGTAGSGGTAGAGGGASGAGGKDAGAPETGSPGAGGGSGGVPDASMGPDASAPDAAPDGPPQPPPCGAPADPNTAKLCLAFDPEVVKLIDTDPELDGNGTLIVSIFDHQPADPNETPAVLFTYPPPKTDGGLEETGIYSLPEFPFDGLPETVYVRTIFADNPVYKIIKLLVIHGAFVGGLDLTQGVVDLSTGNVKGTPVRAVTLKKGEGTRITQVLHAMRKFTTKVSLDVPQVSIADDAQGVISVGVFDVPAPAGQPVLGGSRTGCVKLLAPNVSPFDVSGFMYGTGDFWLGGQIDDFNQGGLSKPGDIVSLGDGTNMQSIPAAQKFTITDQYLVNIPKVSLNTVLPGSTGFTPYACP